MEENNVLPEWEIWVMDGQAPVLMGTVKARSFWTACILFELRSKYEAIGNLDLMGKPIPRELAGWNYDPDIYINIQGLKYAPSKEGVEKGN